MIESAMQMGGIVSMWQACQSTDRSAIETGLTNMGLEDHVPEARTPMACLKAAISDVYTPPDKETKYIIRNHKNGNPGFAVVAEKPGEDKSSGDDWGRVVAVVSLDEKTGDLKLDPYSWDAEQKLKAGMAGAAKWLTAAAVGKSLSGLVEYLGGIPLREAGGVYWLNASAMETWKDIGNVFEQASAKTDGEGMEAKPTAVYVLKVLADEDMIRTVGDMLAASVESQISQIEYEVNNGELQEQACLNRIVRCGGLAKQVQSYADTAGPIVDRLRAAIDKTAVLTAQATVKAAACAYA